MKVWRLLLIFALSLSASVYKGQKLYMKKCKVCHGSGNKLSRKFTQEEWKQFFQNNGAKLLTVHAKTEAKEYFESKKFQKKAKHLRDFFVKFALDSGNVPACSD